jgi:hypothetical protein
MKSKIIFLFLLLTISFTGFSQADVYSFFKLVITNSKKQILLVKWDGAWELPGERYNQPLSTSKFIDSMAISHGIVVNSPKISGIYTFHYSNRINPTLMHYYTAIYEKGTPKTPPDCSDIGWFSKDEAMRLIPYFEMRLILQKALLTKNKVWGGAFKIEGSGINRKSSIFENLYYLK